MSIGIYAFLRIYFLDFGVSVFAQFRTHCASPPAPPPPRSTWHGLSGIECRPVQCVQRPGACVGVPCLVLSALHLARPALLPVLCSLSGCAGVCRGTPAGHTAAAQPRPVSPVTTEKNKKGSKITPPPLPILKISRKNKKTPTKGLCSVLYLPYKP